MHVHAMGTIVHGAWTCAGQQAYSRLVHRDVGAAAGAAGCLWWSAVALTSANLPGFRLYVCGVGLGVGLIPYTC